MRAAGSSVSPWAAVCPFHARAGSPAARRRSSSALRIHRTGVACAVYNFSASLFRCFGARNSPFLLPPLPTRSNLGMYRHDR